MKFIYLLIALIVLIATAGVRTLELSTKCQDFCDPQYTPICGTNDEGQSRTFSNQCVLSSENCLRGSNYQKTADGECP